MNRLLWAAVGGVLFGFGLAFSGMARPEVVLSFLQ
ncbi:MAG: YeeE/YedE family protein, partial [bacterium]